MRRRPFSILAATALVMACLAPTAAGAEGPEQIGNGTFDTTDAPWWHTGNLTVTIDNGQLCADVPGGTVNPWDAIIGYDNVPLLNGETYAYSFFATATPGRVITALVQLPIDPFTQYLSAHPDLSVSGNTYNYTFTSPVDLPTGQVAFQIGGSATPWRFCVDNVSLKGGAEPVVYKPDTGPRVRVNQVAYLPKGPKGATLVTDATSPLPWQLKRANGTVAKSGTTTPRGVNATSGQNVHSIDFSSFTTAGQGYTLVADGETSRPFDIDAAAYQTLAADALKFFYTQRSGIAISDALRPGYARPAGHIGVAPNQGDTSVPCQAGVCDYRLDVSGGWYDAGDHGKYVVNGGISVAQVMGTFERTKNAVTSAATPNLVIPESGNAVPDILDEARFEQEFLLKMQRPDGMVHHKIHDQNWTGLPLLPNIDPQPRELHPVSTAATLNLAAAAAQAARVYAPYDAAFAAKNLAAARKAWAAAKANPAIYASVTDGNGGGTYDDTNVTDEFYWAAAELYITTGEKEFKDFVTSSPLNTADIFTDHGFSWQSVAPLGRIDLATVPNNLPGRAAVRQSVVAGADKYLAIANGNAYGSPYDPDSYDWGSDSQVANNINVIGAAYDVSGDLKYRNAALQGVDYLLGRNALNMSYITGYGEANAHNEHSRWYAHSLDAALPNPPHGTLSGGPNSGIQDPVAQANLMGCKPQFCYIDDVGSYATNEEAINWNSALSWTTGFIAGQGDGTAPKPGNCKVTYAVPVSVPQGFAGVATIKNTGSKAIDGWALTWSFLGGQKVTQISNAALSQSGATVTAKNMSFNKRINPGKSVTIAFIGKNAPGANPVPDLFTLNGLACA
ncbi:glycoside hydrolase family 9 protein [Streptosporangiaceae bacterium NEAU-GS5]|nr:glycoside hydrolase family 9 protein [Streptosporangiaceae bacterium NEAU-GS5]